MTYSLLFVHCYMPFTVTIHVAIKETSSTLWTFFFFKFQASKALKEEYLISFLLPKQQACNVASGAKLENP